MRPLRMAAAVAAAAAMLGAGGVVASLISSAPAAAFSSSQAKCATPFMSITPSQGYVAIPGAALTVNNGTVARNVELNFSADANVSPNGEMRMTWALDGATPSDYTYGPGNLAENQQFDGTRTSLDIAFGVPAGTHTFQAYARISGNSTTSGVIDRFCSIALNKVN